MKRNIENILFTDSSCIKKSSFEIYDNQELLKTNISYEDVCEYLLENKYNLFTKYIKIKILAKSWDANYFIKHILE